MANRSNNPGDTEDTSVLTVAAAEADAGTRIDRFLADRLPQFSRARLQALIRDSQVSMPNIGRTVLNPAQPVKPDDCFVVTVPAVAPAVPQPQAISLDIVFEDNDIIVINKPAGLVAHPAPGHADGTLVNALLHHCGDSLSGIGGVKRPGIVHRIDKDTSGLLVVAKTDAAHQGLSAQFAAHTAGRTYLAVVRGIPSPRENRIEGAIGRNPRNRKKMAVVTITENKGRGGKQAATYYRLIEPFYSAGRPLASTVECRLETGRTHQVRVHMTHIGHPLIGDPLYGRAARLPKSAPSGAAKAIAAFPRQALHAASLSFDHPGTGEAFNFSADTPYDIEALITALRGISTEKTPV